MLHQAIARAWAQAGAAGIVLAGRKAESLELTADNVSQISKNIPIIVQRTDVSDETSVRSLFAKTKTQFSKVDVLVNAAGSMGGGMIGELPLASWWADFVSRKLPRFSNVPLKLIRLLFVGDKRQRHISYDSELHSEFWRWRNHYQLSQYWSCFVRAGHQLLCLE